MGKYRGEYLEYNSEKRDGIRVHTGYGTVAGKSLSEADGECPRGISVEYPAEMVLGGIACVSKYPVGVGGIYH